ncbi:MAG TPA: FxsA family protein [Nocardioidaceae bacterium]|nr:FxsA family protein [Nocardioidaceae bacterium]
MSRRGPWGLLAALFVIVPLVEIYFIIQVGQAIGPWWTVLILVADSVLGAALLKREGTAAWRALRDAMASYRLPARELADGALVLVGGTLLLTPGFVTDLFGFFFILPFTRPLARRALTAVITRKFLGGPGGPSSTSGDRRTRQRPGPDSVVQGEVVD